MKRAFFAVISIAALLPAQNAPMLVEAPHGISALRPYLAPAVQPIRLQNSSRLYGLMRAGNLYLTVQDALALAIENNLNLEIDRYGPWLADSALERAKAGGPLRGVLPGIAQINSVDAGVGVNGSIAAAGLPALSSATTSNVGGSGGASIQQIGVIVPNFDATLQNATSFSHITSPEANTIVAQTNSLVQYSHTYNTQLTQGLITGGTIQYREYQQTFGENAPGDFVNPSSAARMDLVFRQPLLQGFGMRLNDRTIRVSRINVTAAREVFRGRAIDLATNVLNLYYSLVSANDELRARQHALEIAQKFYEDTRKEIAANAIPGIQLPAAEAEVSSRRQELSIAQSNVRQEEVQLKEAISHTEDPALEAAGIVLVDRIQIPESDNLPPVRELVATAMAKRPDVAVARYRDQTNAINLAGTENPLLPTLNLYLQTYDRGVAGDGHTVKGEPPNPDFVGGYGRSFQQVLSHDFPNQIAAIGMSVPFHNRLAQADYGIDQLQYRQGQVSNQKDVNTIVVDVAARVAALRQSHARYDTARDTRNLEEQLLAADQQRFESGGNITFNNLMADQRALVAAQISEVNALAEYARARTSLDQVLGETLEKYNITLEEGLDGRIERQSQIPEAVEQQK